MMQYCPFITKSVFLNLLLILVPLGGCAFFQDSPKIEPAIPQEKEWAGKYEILVKESRAEADRLRSELATIKIAAAKNNGKLQLTPGATSVQTEKEVALTSEVQKLKTDILKLQEERDQLRNQNVQLQARSEALPGMRQLVMDIKALQTSVYQLVTKMEILSSDIIQVKNDMAIQEHVLQTVPHKITKRTKTEPREVGDELVPEHASIIVEYGDTLWDIARAHGISVNELKEINDLESDAIYEDQQLLVPRPHSPPSESPTQPAFAATNSNEKSNEVNDHKGAPNAQEAP
jgi:LysM repeat protein